MPKINLEDLQKIKVCFYCSQSYDFDIDAIEELSIKAHAPQMPGDEKKYQMYCIEQNDILKLANKYTTTALIPNNTCFVEDGHLTLKKDFTKQIKANVEQLSKIPCKKSETFGDSQDVNIGDIELIYLYYKNGDIEECYIPCKPFEGRYLNLIDFSNCPSVDHDDNFYKFYFGASSTAPCRIDNNYKEIIKDFPFETNEILKVIPTYFYQGYSLENGRYEISAKLKIVGGKLSRKELRLEFLNAKYLSFEHEDDIKLDAENFEISQFENGEIWVSIGDWCEFMCDKINFTK